MKSKTTLIVVLVIVVILVGWYLATRQSAPVPAPAAMETATTTAPIAPPGLSSVTPLATSSDSVRGVDLGAFTSQANQSAMTSSSDGSSDAQSLSGDGSSINNAMDSQNTSF